MSNQHDRFGQNFRDDSGFDGEDNDVDVIGDSQDEMYANSGAIP
jgi:hypothetical protein